MSIVSAERKLNKILSSLKNSFGITINFNKISTQKLEETFVKFSRLKQKIVENSNFNSYVQDPNYAKATLVCEAINVYLKEIAPNRKRRHRPRKKPISEPVGKEVVYDNGEAIVERDNDLDLYVVKVRSPYSKTGWIVQGEWKDYDIAVADADEAAGLNSEHDPEDDPFMTDAEADADALASAGFGTDEDYGMYESRDLTEQPESITEEEFNHYKQEFQNGNNAIDYAYRNAVVLDEEETRILDDYENMDNSEWRNLWKPQLSDDYIEELEAAINSRDWEMVADILEPHISNRQLSLDDFYTWEAILLSSDYEDFLGYIEEGQDIMRKQVTEDWADEWDEEYPHLNYEKVVRFIKGKLGPGWDTTDIPYNDTAIDFYNKKTGESAFAGIFDNHVVITDDDGNSTKYKFPKNVYRDHLGENKKLGLSKLLETDMEKARLIFAINDITDRLQKMAEDIAKMSVNDIMPIIEDMKSVFGAEKTQRFEDAANEELDEALEAVKKAKEALSNETLRLEGKDVPDNDMANDDLDDEKEESDLDIDMADDSNGDDESKESEDVDDDEDIDIDDLFGAAEEDEPLGRAKKESAYRRGNVLTEGKKNYRNDALSKEVNR